MKRWLFSLFLVLLTGCATNLPPGIADAPERNPSPNTVRQAPERFAGTDVRWGGTIAGIRNEEDATFVEVVARPLRGNGRPRDGDRSIGRFLARVEGFLDPVIYEPDRTFTVYGTVDGTRVIEVGDYPYPYPVVDVNSHHLWQPLPERDWRDYDPFWYSPVWLDPWHPWYWHPTHRYYRKPR